MHVQYCFFEPKFPKHALDGAVSHIIVCIQSQDDVVSGVEPLL